MDIIQRIKSLEKYGIKPGLERISALLEYMDHPESSYKKIIVGGTNGKGSTCAMLDSILRSAGYRTGLYTSPHLVFINERIKINNIMIDDASLNDTAEKLFYLSDKHTGLSDITYFEFLTALALQYFKDRHIDVAVLEVGMGGRFDATNAVQPIVSTITNISMDHQSYLGNTIKDIAMEKAGIIRDKKPFITTDINPVSRQVLEAECKKKGGILYAIDRDFSYSGDETNMIFYNNDHTIKDLKLSLAGKHQMYNAAAAIQSVLMLEQAGIKVSYDSIKDGLLKAAWPGRFEIIHRGPDLIIDSAHNPAGIQTLVQTVKDNYRNMPVTVIFAVSRDKDWRTMITMLSEIAESFIFTSYKGERSADPDELKNFISPSRQNSQGILNRIDVVMPSNKALKYALDITPRDGVIIATGSIYFIGELKSLRQDHR